GRLRGARAAWARGAADRDRGPGQAAAEITATGHRPCPRSVRAERTLGGAAALLQPQRRHLPRSAGAGPGDPGGAAAGGDLLRPDRRADGDPPADGGAAGALLTGGIRAARRSG